MTTYRAPLHREDGEVWTEVLELPGCFAVGDTAYDLAAALPEVIRLYLDAPDLSLAVVDDGDRLLATTY